MPKEIERKFLVVDGAVTRILQGAQGVRIRQGYLSTGPNVTLRVRLKGEGAYLTVKLGRVGISCDEFEYPIPMNEALEMLQRAEADLEKTRYEVPYAGHRWEVDVFHGKLAGLIVAELELKSEKEVFPRPPWLGEEVSHLPQFSNAFLARYRGNNSLRSTVEDLLKIEVIPAEGSRDFQGGADAAAQMIRVHLDPTVKEH